MSEREQRRLRILAIVSERAIHTQDELAEALAQEGWVVSQSTMSRDIADLGLVKANGAYRRPPTPVTSQTSADEQWVGEGVLKFAHAGETLVILHTMPGDAQSVARAIDRLAWSEAVGTLAGDDTIFIAVDSRSAQRGILRTLRKLVSVRS